MFKVIQMRVILNDFRSRNFISLIRNVIAFNQGRNLDGYGSIKRLYTVTGRFSTSDIYTTGTRNKRVLNFRSTVIKHIKEIRPG